MQVLRARGSRASLRDLGLAQSVERLILSREFPSDESRVEGVVVADPVSPYHLRESGLRGPGALLGSPEPAVDPAAVAHQPLSRGRSEGESPTLGGGETIAAIATPAGRGGIGVVRVSGSRAAELAREIVGEVPAARYAKLAAFKAADGGVIDQGLALYFRAPHSYTGEDVLELQGHGGPVVMQLLLRRCIELGARVAQPGEFTRRAFLNDRIDLAQAESVADLIDASSAEAARSAARSLAGEFPARIRALVDSLTELRVHVEACIDFPEEEIDPADLLWQDQRILSLQQDLDLLLRDARQGVILREGLTVVLVGEPNVGKSSLLNRLVVRFPRPAVAPERPHSARARGGIGWRAQSARA